MCENEGVYVCSTDRSTTVCNVAAFQAYPEECDDMDNDCDGQTDEDLVGCCDVDAVQECGSDVGECVKGEMTCQEDGSWGDCENAVGPTVDLCDSLDNDCDGATDEDFLNRGMECQIGQGNCLSNGNYACTEDMFGTFCAALIIQPSNEACDQQDNDCDGATDEDLVGCCEPNDQVECGSAVGECRKGHKTCSIDGVWSECLEEVKPMAELCDGKDNNCDGQTDETFANLNSECQIGRGECLSIGRMTCGVDQQSTSCNADILTGNDEICDNKDNDCDGDVDENLLRECGSDVGECEIGIQSCFAGGWLACEGEIQSSDEICDNLDNNCDGNTDEGFNINDQCFEGLGECQAEGVIVCVDENMSACNAVVGQQSEETCDGLDNDCDGNTDEELENCCIPDTISECGIDTGECVKGTSTCQADRTWGWCLDATGPSDEICDGLDNNCDGETDEGLTGCCSPSVSRNCGSDVGECSHGTQICWESREWGECQNQTLPANEICDGLDNDCDGQTDNGFDLMAEANNCGQCNYVCGSQGTVSTTCEAGECVLTCSRFRVDLNTDPTDGCECEVTNCGVEICDQVDNDCDGAIDEDCDSLVMYLSFDGHMNDGSTNANNALNHGATYTADAVCGQAASFDGVDDYAEVADSVSMDSIVNEFTICVSANVTDYERGDVVFSKFRLQPALGIEWNDVTMENNWTFFLNRVKLAQGRTVNVNQWITFCGKFKQGVFTAYIDGEQIWQGNAQNPVGGITYIGSNDMPPAKNSHTKIDETTFYNVALSDEEIQHYFEIMKR
ncbi:MAG: MopE-related protein [Patescibacteria group bacterium]